MAIESLRFYHVEKSPTIEILYQLLTKTFGADKTAHILSRDDENSENLCAQLWKYNKGTLFLPIAVAHDYDDSIAPKIYIGTPLHHQCDYLFLYAYGDVQHYLNTQDDIERIFLIFDGHDDQELSWARQSWRDAKQYRDEHNDAITLEYWQQNQQQGWQQKISV